MTHQKKTLFGRFMKEIRSLFFNGLLILLPIAITFWLFSFTFKLLKSWLAPIYHLEPASLQAIPYSEVFLTILFIFALGAIIRFFLLHPFISALESLVEKIPLVSPVYFGIKQLVHAFTVFDDQSFNRVVMVEFPRPGVYSIGFSTREVPTTVSPDKEQRYLNIFIPTTPNPTTGFFVMVKESECFSTELTRQEAMALIISGGIIMPDRYLKTPITR